MPPITWTERMCVLNPKDWRLTISVLNSIFFPLKSSLSKRIIVGSENSYLGTKIMFYYSSLMVTWAHVKIILFQRQSTRSGQVWRLVSSLSQKVWVFMCSGARERKNGGQKKICSDFSPSFFCISFHGINMERITARAKRCRALLCVIFFLNSVYMNPPTYCWDYIPRPPVDAWHRGWYRAL